MEHLLAVDLGIRTGLALYEKDAGLVWYRSKNFGSSAALRRGAHTLLSEIEGLGYLVIEGGGALADIWIKEGRKKGAEVILTGAEAWRKEFLFQSQQRTGREAKNTAGVLARKAIEHFGARRSVALRHDAAEAIMIGLWGILKAGWINEIPDALRRHGTR